MLPLSITERESRFVTAPHAPADAARSGNVYQGGVWNS